MTQALIAAGILGVLMSYDGWTTEYLLNHGHTELNPITAWAITVVGTPVAFLVEWIFCAGLGLWHPWITWVIVVAEFANDIRQYKLVKG